MSYVPIIAATHAAKAARQRREEEENMAEYSKDDLDGWEFKIMRSAFGKFRNPDFVRELCAEEAKSGWELVEKFDDNRIRFKRRTDRRSMDSHHERNPYRTSADTGASVILWAALGIILVLLGIGAALLASFSSGQTEWTSLGIVFLVIILLAVVVVARRVSGRRVR